MPKLTPVLSPLEPDQALIQKLERFKRTLLALVSVVGVFTVCGWSIPALGRMLPDGWQLMRADAALAVLFSALSLALSEPRHSKQSQRLSLLLAALVALLAASALVDFRSSLSHSNDAALSASRETAAQLWERMPPQIACAFELLGLSMLLLGTKKRVAVQVADLLVFFLCLLLLVLLSAYIFRATRMFGLPTSGLPSAQTLLCLLLLTVVAVLRRAQHGVFAIFLGRGIGSRIARALAPIVLVLPFIREISRAHLVNTQLIPAHYVTAILTSIAAMLSFILVLLIAWRINSMEREIQDLSLRDELTGLYNLRGFSFLAEQGLRMAQRARVPYSILFIDLDNLKQVNDELGHGMGSAFLTETGGLLRATFRETDVIARLGGDEFVVAGQFTNEAISIAAQRLRTASSLRNTQTGRRLPLNLSIGCITTDEALRETLEELLAKADSAMYQEKRRKKLELD
jgi:diguanylate cyclase (GGDEF)-like protein